jgi:hypothetical protein
MIADNRQSGPEISHAHTCAPAHANTMSLAVATQRNSTGRMQSLHFYLLTLTYHQFRRGEGCGGHDHQAADFIDLFAWNNDASRSYALTV